MAHQRNAFLPALRYRALTGLYDPLVRITTRELAFKRALIKMARFRPGDQTLDLACGTGTLAFLLKRHFSKQTIHAVDADPQILEIARRKALEKNSKINFIIALSDALPFAAATFDNVFSTLFFHHITLAEKQRTLAEIRRVLKPGGRFLLGDFARPKNIWQKILSRVIILTDGPERVRDNLEGRLEPLIEESGLQKVGQKEIFQTALGTIRLFTAEK